MTAEGGNTAELGAARAMLRHTLATLAYRGDKAVSGADPSFAEFRPHPTSRSAVEILAHIGDLLDWALWFTRGEHRWDPRGPLPWDKEVERFFDGLRALDEALASEEPLGTSTERIFQGPIADALTHVGQINLMRRMAGSPVRGENYARATIAAGSVGPVGEPKRYEFD